MKHKLTLILIILFFAGNIFANGKNPCDCSPTTKVTKQYRTDAKHETNFNNFSKAKYEITPNIIIGWEKKYKSKTNDIGKDDIRWNLTPEDSLYVLKGWMYFMKQEANDCDFHIEIGPENQKSNSRVIVEITNNNCDLQKKVYNYITSKGFKLNKQFDYGLECTVTGLGFYDGTHKPAQHGGTHTHKTSWELHPVKTFEFQ